MINEPQTQKIRIGTRGSPLALKQASLLNEALQEAYPQLDIEIIKIKSAADWKKQDGEIALNAQAGGKGQFAKEIEDFHMKGKIDCGVHSLKDMPAFLPDGLQIIHYLPRADARDAFISAKYKNLNKLPKGAIVGTCSPRRAALALHQRPDLNIVPFRGNVQTRLEKVREGQVDATFLAMAGIERLEIRDEMIYPIDVEAMLPACGQGVVCMETEIGNDSVGNVMQSITCNKTALCAKAERAVLKTLDGSCHTPIAAYAIIKGEELYLRAQVISLDGAQIFEKEITQRVNIMEDASQLGEEIGAQLKAVVPKGILYA